LTHYNIPLLTTSNYNVNANLRTLEFTVTHTLEFSVFTSHILVTDFNTVVILVSHMKSCCHCSANSHTPKTRHNSILLFPSPHPGRLASRNSTNSSQLNSLYNHFARAEQKHNFRQYPYYYVFIDPFLKNWFFCCRVPIRLRKNVFTEPLPSNMRSSGTLIPAFGRHVTIY
jgi:hypothetical protein